MTKAPHLIVQARAGTGKTSTMTWALDAVLGNDIPEGIVLSGQQTEIFSALCNYPAPESIAFVAFGKSIAKELQSKVSPPVEASTMHSMGYSAIRDSLGRVKVNNFKVDNIIEKLTGTTRRRSKNPAIWLATRKLVSLVKNTLSDDLDRLVERFGIDLNGTRSAIYDLVPQVLKECSKLTKEIDYDDMLWFVVEKDLPVKSFDLLLVDEAQDLNRVQQEIAMKVIGDTGRMVLIGDDRQAIYGFRGADSDSINYMSDVLSDTDRGIQVLPLTVTRRCPKSVVALAQKIVSDIESHEDAPEGTILYSSAQDALEGDRSYTEGDMILCRTNAPLCKTAFAIIRQGRKAIIQGRDIGQGLISLVNKLDQDTVSELSRELDSFEFSERRRIMGRQRWSEAQVQSLEDRCDCIRYLSEGLSRVSKLIQRIKDVFADVDRDGKPKEAVLLSSVHRAKGLEARTVWILHPELLPHPMAKQDWEMDQEQNIKYVALTRSQDTLVFVKTSTD